jgi:hypothetical protein
LSQIFSKSSNKIPPVILAGLLIAVAAVIGGIWYWWSPWFTDVGYAPKQPGPYSHKLHAGDLHLDCRYCHTGVEVSAVAMVPPTQTCMNCHTLLKPDSPKLKALRASWENKQPMEWVRVHKTPDYAYFNHSAHIGAGVGCESCHGNIASMEVVHQDQPLSMGWCLDCHRNPDAHLRPAADITKMGWKPAPDHDAFVARLKKERGINPPITCSGCHR